MFDFIRTHQRLMQLVLLLLILPSFVLIGVSGYTTYTNADDELVTLANGAITVQAFDQARRAQLDQFQRQLGETFDPALLDTPAARRALLESLVDRYVVASVAEQQRFSVSDNALRQAIAAVPDFQEDGQFSPERYYAWLNMAGFTSTTFEASQRAELALSRVLTPVGTTATIPATIATGLRNALVAERTVRLRPFPAAQYRTDTEVTQEELETWYAQHSADYALPEFVNIQYLVLDEAAAMANLPPVPEDDLQHYYTQNKTQYGQAGRVNLSHILLTMPADATAQQRTQIQAQAQAIAARAATESFADLAREVSQDAGSARNGGTLGWVSRGLLPPALEDVVFSLPEGAVSDVVEGDQGLHIFRADAVQAEVSPSFAEVRDQVLDVVTRERGAQRYADMASQLTTLVYDNTDSLTPIANTLGLTLRSATGIARNGLLSALDAGENAASVSTDATMLQDVRLRRALFAPESLNQRQNSGVITIAADTLLVALVTEVQPASVPALTQVHDRVRERVLTERALAAARQAGEAELAHLQGTEDHRDSAPDGFDAAQPVSRLQQQGVEPALFNAIFQTPTQNLPAYVGAEQGDAYVIARIEAANSGSQEALDLLASLPTELAQTWGNLEQQAVLRHLRTQTQVKWLPRAEQAIQGESNF